MNTGRGISRFARAMAAAALAAALCGAASGQTNWEALVEEGQLALDTGRLDEASALFGEAATLDPSRAEELAPDRAWVHVRLANDALAAGDDETAERSYSLAAAMYPDYIEIFRDSWAFASLSLANNRIEAASRDPRHADWKAIERELKWIQSMEPGEADISYTLGVFYQMQGKNDLARREYAAALGGKPVSRNKSISALKGEVERGLRGRKYAFNLRPVYPPRLAAEPGEFKTYKRGPFVIYNHNGDLARRVANCLEYYLSLPVLDGVLTADDSFPDECKVYIFSDEDSFRRSGGKEVWAGGQSKLVFAGNRVIRVTIQLFQTTPELTESAVPHELAHVRLAASEYFFDGMPLWLLEGVAMSTESHYKKMSAARTVSRALDTGVLISLADLFTMKTYPEQGVSEIFYAESVALVESLVSGEGTQQFRAFMKALKSNDATEALSEVYGLSLPEAEDLVIAWAKAHMPPQQ